MRSVQLSAFAVLALGALAPSALATQTFSFGNPFASTGSSYANSQFESVGVPSSNFSTLQNFYTGTVKLAVVGGSTDTGTSPITAYYRLRDLSGSSVINGSKNPSLTYTTEGGVLEFSSSPTFSNAPLLVFTFVTGLESTGGFGAASASGNNVTVAGSLVDPGANQATAKFSFGFPAPILGPANTLHYTSNFTSSVEAVPEPASMGVMAIGALALLRRRRRA